MISTQITGHHLMMEQTPPPVPPVPPLLLRALLGTKGKARQPRAMFSQVNSTTQAPTQLQLLMMYTYRSIVDV